MIYKTQLVDPRWKAKREEILERDGFACRVCFSTKKLNVHHISYADYLWEVPNESLITLCHSCHRKEHGEVNVRLLAQKLDTTNLFSGMVFHNYKALCAYLNKPVLTGGCKIRQFKVWRNCFSFEQQGHKILIVAKVLPQIEKRLASDFTPLWFGVVQCG